MRLVVKQNQDVHKKGWGHEVWIHNDDLYCGKLLVIEKDKKCSLHFHMDKTETMYLQSGQLRVLGIDSVSGKRYEIIMNPGESLEVEPGMIHQLWAIERCELFEFSTKHDDRDSYRVEKGD